MFKLEEEGGGAGVGGVWWQGGVKIPASCSNLF